MPVNRMVLNETAYFGKGAVDFIADEMKKRNFRSAFVVTDKELVECQVTGHVTDVLERENIKYGIYDDIKPNPTIENVQNGVKEFQRDKWDCIIAVGGGSVIDTAKAIGIIHKNPDFSDVRVLEGVADTKNRSMPVIAVPTTAGTAAEVTINYVITDNENKKKLVCIDTNDIPVLAIVDSDLMKSMPTKLAASTGMDALTHAIEGYTTKGAWELSDTLSLKAIRLIASNIVNAVKGREETAIESMGLAQYMAGMAFSNVGLGLVHGMAHPLGARYDTPHGIANALLLPYVMEFNADSTGEKYRFIAQAMGVKNTDKMSEKEYRKAAVDAVKKLVKELALPSTLKEINIPDIELKQLAEDAHNDVCTPGNPKKVTKEQILCIYQKAYSKDNNVSEGDSKTGINKTYSDKSINPADSPQKEI
ncbi:MAG: lactaldehyde reductase [Bacillota bacterium]|nr:lactaldehyde reductase [Bacillota bacterium]